MIGMIYPPTLFHGGATISKVMCGSEQIWPSGEWWAGNYVKAHLIEHDRYGVTHIATAYFSRNNSKVLIDGDDRYWSQWPYGYGIVDLTHVNPDTQPMIYSFEPREIDALPDFSMTECSRPEISISYGTGSSDTHTAYIWGIEGIHYAFAHNIKEVTMECWCDGSQKPTIYKSYSKVCITSPTDTKQYAEIIVDCDSKIVTAPDADEVRVTSEGYEVYYNTTETSIYKYTVTHGDDYSWFDKPTVSMDGNRVKILFPKNYIESCINYNWTTNDFDIYVGDIMPATLHLYAIISPELYDIGKNEHAQLFQGDILTTGVGTFDTAGITSYWGKAPTTDRDVLIIKVPNPYVGKRWADDSRNSLVPRGVYISTEHDSNDNMLICIDKEGLMKCFGPFNKPGEMTISISPTVMKVNG